MVFIIIRSILVKIFTIDNVLTKHHIAYKTASKRLFFYVMIDHGYIATLKHLKNHDLKDHSGITQI